MRIGRFILVGAFLLAAPALRAKPSWRTVEIPLLPPDASLRGVWSDLSGDVYVWARTLGGPSGDVPTVRLLHWDGERWREDLKLAGYEAADVFGTDPRNVFAGVNKCDAGIAAGCGATSEARIFRSTDGGMTWTPQTLPPQADGRTMGRLDGTADNIHTVVGGTTLIRFDGKEWSAIFKGTKVPAEAGDLVFSFQSANEAYMANGAGWGRWINGAWKFMPAEFGFRNARALWGIRDRAGDLRLYAVDGNKFSNGLRVWRFSPVMEDFETEVSEGSPDDGGNANGLWGSAEDDIYAIGQVGDAARVGSGRIYHFNGKAWAREKSVEPLSPPMGIHGTSRNDVWISLADGRLLHYSTAAAVTRKMAQSGSAR